VRVGGSFAGEVAGVEFLDGGVDVVDVETNLGRDPIVVISVTLSISVTNASGP